MEVVDIPTPTAITRQNRNTNVTEPVAEMEALAGVSVEAMTEEEVVEMEVVVVEGALEEVIVAVVVEEEVEEVIVAVVVEEEEEEAAMVEVDSNCKRKRNRMLKYCSHRLSVTF